MPSSATHPETTLGAQASTGSPAAIASAYTSGNPSYQALGKTRPTERRIRRDHLGPRHPAEHLDPPARRGRPHRVLVGPLADDAKDRRPSPAGHAETSRAMAFSGERRPT